jgi:hypothetical protein
MQEEKSLVGNLETKNEEMRETGDRRQELDITFLLMIRAAGFSWFETLATFFEEELSKRVNLPVTFFTDRASNMMYWMWEVMKSVRSETFMTTYRICIQL